MSNGRWQEAPDLSWLDSILNHLEALSGDSGRWEDFGKPLKELVSRFDDLMSFGCHMALVEQSAVLSKMECVAELIDGVLKRTTDLMATRGGQMALNNWRTIRGTACGKSRRKSLAT